MNANRSIAYSMTQTVVLLTLFLGLIIGSVQVAWDYQQRIDALNSRVNEVLKSIEKAAVKAVYTFDTDLAAEVASGLFEFKPISSVIIKDENNKVMTTMVRYPGPFPYEYMTKFLFQKRYLYHVPLTSKIDLNHTIGTLTIEVTPHETVFAFLDRSITILLAAVLQSFVISLLLLAVFYRKVTRPLHLLARDFTKINPESPEKSSLTLEPSLKMTEFERVTTAGNNLLRVIGLHLREKDKAETKLKHQKDETERYLKIAEAIILQLDRNGKVIMINQRGLDVMGYHSYEVLGHDWFKFAVPHDEQEGLRSAFADLFNLQGANDGEPPSSYHENNIITKSGAKRRIFWHNALEIDQYGTVTGILSSGQDVTARKEAEEQLRATEGSLRTIIEATSEGFAILNHRNWELVDINSALCEMLGYQKEDMLFHSLSVFVHEGDREQLDTYLNFSESHPHQSYEMNLENFDGELVPVEISISALPVEQTEQARSVAFVTDITARKNQEERQNRLEKQLRQAQKMETIGTLAGGIAHDFNNILTPILGYSSLLTSRIPEDDPNHKRIQQIAASANRAADMVKQILTFSRRSEGEMISTYLSPVCKEAMELVRTMSPSNIEIKQYISTSCPPVIADSTQIQQLILNLCTNANQAMSKEGGELEVRVEVTDITEAQAFESPILNIGEHIRITVSDTGHGMDEEVLSRIFDPFYTTKKSGEGTGLGLAMVHGIVHNHKGEIYVESSPDRGTTFKVFLPITTSPVEAEAVVETIQAGNKELVLVVDDEPLNIRFMEELLEDIGYDFVSFTDSVQALDAFMEDPDRFNIILTDQTMPKLSGDQLVKAVREIRTEMPIIMMSGFDKEITEENAGEFGVDIYLQKPISIHSLAASMTKLLNNAKETEE